MKILFICRGNVGRSQMAEALFRKRFGNLYEVMSAGTKLSGPEQPIGELMPQIEEVLAVMKEEGIDISMSVRKQLTEEMLTNADRVFVVMEKDEELPEYLLVSPKPIRWSIADPKGKDVDFTREVKDQIKKLIFELTL